MLLTLLFVSFEVQATPTPANSKTPLPLKGPRLPVYRWDEIDSSILNGSRKEIAHALRVRDLHVYSYNDDGSTNAIQQRVLSNLKTSGYTLNKFSWNPQTGITGFYAKREKEVIGAVWIQGSRLYWGHVTLLTPQSQLDDGLMEAVYDGDLDAGKRFLSKGASPYARDYDGDSVLKVAADRNRVAITKIILAAQRAQPSVPVSNEILGALKVASYKNHPEIVQAILDNGVTPYQIGIAMKSAVSFGTGGSIDVVKVLLPVASQYDIDANLVTAVYVDFYRGSNIQYPDIVKLLLTRKPSKDALNKALLSAAEVDQVFGIVPMLIAAGADVNVRNAKGETPLLRASRNGWYKTEQPDVLALLNAGADPDIGDNNGTTSLMRAAVYNSPETVKLLLAHGANPNKENKAGHNAIYFIEQFVKSKPYKETLQKVLENQQIIETAMKKNTQ
jgi:ankyrin repeat protein